MDCDPGTLTLRDPDNWMSHSMYDHPIESDKIILLRNDERCWLLLQFEMNMFHAVNLVNSRRTNS